MMKFLRVLVAPFFWIFYPLTIVNKKRFKKHEKSVIVMNHLSAFDPILIFKGLYLDVHFLSKKELVNSRFKRWFFRQAHVISVDRDNVSLDTMKASLNVLKAGKTLGIYPEGTRNRSGSRELRPLKSGSALFALMGKAPVYPIAIADRTRMFHRSWIFVGEPFELSEFYGKKPNKEVLDLATERIREELEGAMRQLDEYLAARKKKA